MGQTGGRQTERGSETDRRQRGWKWDRQGGETGRGGSGTDRERDRQRGGIGTDMETDRQRGESGTDRGRDRIREVGQTGERQRGKWDRWEEDREGEVGHAGAETDGEGEVGQLSLIHI